MNKWERIRKHATALHAKHGGNYELWWNEACRNYPEDAAAASVPLSRKEFANERASTSRQEAVTRKANAREKFMGIVAEKTKIYGYDKAFQMSARQHTQFFNDMNLPIFTQQQCVLLGLSPNSTQDEAAAAYVANGRKFDPLSVKDIHLGMVQHYAKDEGLSNADAITKIRQTHPRLGDAMAALGTDGNAQMANAKLARESSQFANTQFLSDPIDHRL